jgi:hypothetical protein
MNMKYGFMMGRGQKLNAIYKLTISLCCSFRFVVLFKYFML